ncbi:MAG TPA: flagellar biosynthesis protein FlhB [Gaiellaceae bacterium]|jgi:flagellar biosynthetic protein FlhB
MEGKGGKTEKATGKKKGEARKKGQVARSNDVNVSVGLIAVFSVLIIGGPHFLKGLEHMLSQNLSTVGDTSKVSDAGLEPMIHSSLGSFASAVAPLVGTAAVAGILASVAQVRFKWSMQALKPKFTMLNPVHGIKKLFGVNGLVETIKALVKLAIVGGVAFMAIWSQLPHLGSLVGIPPNELLSEVGHRIQSIAIRVVAVLALLGILDLIWQRRKFAKSLMMSKEEVKQEARQADVAPELRGAIKRKQFEMARRRMLADIPTADVVIVNPTHFAVALRYDPLLPAPQVVAKGVDHIAAAIRAAAKEHDVPIIENPPLARTIYREVEIGTMIPEVLFVAVAEVLAFVFRTAKGRARAKARAATARRRLATT